jgi:hypothetical protein
MLKRTSLVVRLFVMVALAFGLGTLMASPAAAQETQVGQCQTIIDGEINQDPCTIEIDGEGQCQVVIGEDVFQNAQGCGIDTCPRQIIAEGNIFQFQCGDVIPPTDVPPTEVPPTEVPPTDVPPTEVPPTDVPPTDVPATEVPTEEPTEVPTETATATATATHAPDDDGDDDGGQANPDDDGDDDGGKAEEDKEMEVSVLPSTGQGPDSGQSNSANMLLLGAMGAVLTLGAVAMRLRNHNS